MNKKNDKKNKKIDHLRDLMLENIVTLLTAFLRALKLYSKWAELEKRGENADVFHP